MTEPNREQAVAALGDLQDATRALRRISGLADTAVLARRAAREAGLLLGTDLTSVAVLERPGLLHMRGSYGTRTESFPRLRIPSGAGLGGKILVLDRPLAVSDYAHDPLITHEFVDVVVHGEGIGGLAGVPIRNDGAMVGVLYAGIRSLGEVGDDALTLMKQLADGMAPQLSAAMAADRRLHLGIQRERQRIAVRLHDTIGQLLFGIGVTARGARDRLPATAGNLDVELRRIERQASRAAAYLRDTLRDLAPGAPDEALAAAVQADAAAFTDRSGVPVHLVVMGEPRDVPPATEAALLAVVREGLHNVERHAQASSVVLTLYFGPEATEVVVQDDGRGLPADFEVRAVPRGADGWGLASLLARVQALGGRLELIPNEDGGVTLRAAVRTAATDA